jgi:Uma2 family endonuclease
MADLLERLGDIEPRRIRLRPQPGEATIQDVIEIERRENRLFELVDGVLVEKAMGRVESSIAAALVAALENYLELNDLGAISGEGGMFRLPGNLLRIPDVAFVSWDRFPDEESLNASAPEIAPDLAVEVLSESNTSREMTRKLREYFSAGVRLVWFIDPVSKSVTVFTSPTKSTVISENGTLDGGKLLPNFKLPVSRLFARLKRRKRR